jgi:hypothetical protein
MRRVAMCADRLGQRPKLSFRNVGPRIGFKTLTNSCWHTRSMTVGTPSGCLAVDPGASISTRRTGRGLVVIFELLVQEAQVVIPVLVEPSGGHRVYTASASVLLDTLPGPGRVPWATDLASARCVPAWIASIWLGASTSQVSFAFFGSVIAAATISPNGRPLACSPSWLAISGRGSFPLVSACPTQASGSGNPSRLCQGCLPPSRASPRSDCAQLHRTAATARRGGSLTHPRIHDASWRTATAWKRSATFMASDRMRLWLGTTVRFRPKSGVTSGTRTWAHLL